MIPKYIFLFFLINMVFGKSTELKPKKDPKKAFYYSLIPGGGQVYNKKFKKALVIISIEILAYRAWQNNIHIYNNYENNEYSKIFNNIDFGYTKICIDQPKYENNKILKDKLNNFKDVI